MARLNWKPEKLDALMRTTVEGLGYHFWGMEYLSGADTLRLYIEREGQDAGITSDDCAQVSLHLNAVLEIDQPISGRYSLEVSSPGLERRLFRLEQCQQVIGQRLHLRLYQPDSVEGRRNSFGCLLAISDDQLRLQLEDDEQPEREYAWGDLERISVAPKWCGNQEPVK